MKKQPIIVGVIVAVLLAMVLLRYQKQAQDIAVDVDENMCQDLEPYGEAGRVYGWPAKAYTIQDNSCNGYRHTYHLRGILVDSSIAVIAGLGAGLVSKKLMHRNMR